MRARRACTSLLAALLLLIPLALRAHGHAGHPHTECAVCVASHQAPAVRAPGPSIAAPHAVASPVVTTVVADPACAERPVYVGRGPPAHLPSAPS